MSIHFTVSDVTRNLFHLPGNLLHSPRSLFHSLRMDHERAPRSLSPEQSLLLECYLAGQIPESAWSDYVFETPELARHVDARRGQH
ncbi:MAG: hypothetical protein EOS11_31305 [Mesorhizobium sp.]|uniref:hypothetical protein n=1 Tax=Mesorhizobium sp. TaxID=1871066 RepID=UPI000FE2C115|nr:hypothetical protein [Mesorhizobium sp.]RWN55720.1 MAG: hypothetical protein EOS00_26070 [Mesorhizobium sp.]RWO36760.1 MAG: hypothetical protein EOS11_31305 [Mesorhizobium sp.]RWO78547.1 MAG: hypothetical protein EOS18_17700 [Mesorhizobium sp.]TIN76184.1 MAG: hypothetical protein E5Y09_24535 [Mesorhizobium sp.]TJV53903.1 MAG: hypothetical protein E5Y18_06225 [Mesorhizobium sp.]